MFPRAPISEGIWGNKMDVCENEYCRKAIHVENH
jgi:hypothetical protein